MTLFMLPYALYIGAATKAIWIYMGIHYCVDIFCITTGYHRLISHKSYEAHPVLKFLLLFFGTGTIQNSALVWATDHRLHHQFEDTPKDPYNIRQGFWWAHFKWMLYKDHKDYFKRIPPDLQNDKLVQLQHRFFFPMAFFMSFGVPTIIGYFLGSALGGFVIGGLLRYTLSSHCTFLINSAAHTFGKSRFSKSLTARDNPFLAFLTFGEGYHSFHHKFQNDYRNGIRWYHWDPTKWAIFLFSKVGLARNLKTTPDARIQLAETESLSG